MDLIDDKGRLFGVVNIIDALVVLLVVAVVVAGVALVTQSGSPGGGASSSSSKLDLETRYVTVDLGNQPPAIATTISQGTTVDFANHPSNLTVTDIYISPAKDGMLSVHIRARVLGPPLDPEGEQGTITFGGEPLKVGRTLNLDTATFTAAGPVTEIESSGEAFETAERTIHLEVRDISPSVADAVQSGMTEVVAGRTTARVTERSEAPATVVVESDTGELFAREHPVNRTLSLTLTVQTRISNGDALFHDDPLRIGNTVRLDLGSAVVRGTVTGIE